ncbi:MAG: hypothetical protein U0164_01755 [Gemmatimonadaceae bacterium]
MTAVPSSATVRLLAGRDDGPIEEVLLQEFAQPEHVLHVAVVDDGTQHDLERDDA